MASTKIVIRGLVLPGGMPDIAEKADAEYTSWVLAAISIGPKIRKRFLAGEIPEDVVIVGHSLGANAAINLGNDLADAGMKVKVLALDPTYRNKFRGEEAWAIQSSDPRAWEIDNATNISRDDLYHMNMTRDPKIVKMALDLLNG